MANGDYTYIEIPADDLERAKRFYSEAFGWQFTEQPDFPGYATYTTPAGREGVSGGVGKRGESAGDVIRNYVAVDSIDESVRKVEQLGGSVKVPKSEIPGMGFYAAVTDSEGNEFGLWQNQPGEGAPQG